VKIELKAGKRRKNVGITKKTIAHLLAYRSPKNLKLASQKYSFSS
jgi:hypothetical protein